MSIPGSFVSQGGQLLSWLAREHCVRHPDAVAKAWESMTPHAPTLADCGRMFAAYGQSFTIEQIRYIARHRDALQLARRATSGWQHLKFDAVHGFAAGDDFVAPQPGKLTRFLLIFGWALFASTVATIIALSLGNLHTASAAASFATLCALFAVVEFVELKGKHDARRAIALCSVERREAAPEVVCDVEN